MVLKILSEMKNPTKLDCFFSCGVNGSINPLDEVFTMLRLTADESLKDLKEIDDDSVLCVQYQLLSTGHHVPRPLTDNFPEKTVYEADIMETPLWHEHMGNRTTYRPLLQKYPRRTSAEVKSSSKMSTNVPIHKNAGTGWSAGRGKGFVDHQKVSAERGTSSNINQINRSSRVEYVGYSKYVTNSYGRARQLKDDSWRHRHPNNSQTYDRNNMVCGRGRPLHNANASTSAQWRVKGNSRE